MQFRTSRYPIFAVSASVLAYVACGPAEPRGFDDAEPLAQSEHELIGGTRLVPKSDITKSNVVGTPNTSSLYLNVDDSTVFSGTDNDSSHVSGRSGVNTSRHVVGYAGGPAGTVSRVTVNFRARRTANSGTAQVKLYNGSTLLGSGPVNPLGSSYTNYTATFSGLSVSSVNNLRTEIVLVNTRSSVTSTAHLRYTMVAIDATISDAFTHSMAAFIFKDVSTCVIGDVCTDPSPAPEPNCACIWEDDYGSRIRCYQANENLRAVPPSDPTNGTAPRQCLNLRMTPEELALSRAELVRYRDDVFNWSSGAINVKLDIREVGATDMYLSRDNMGMWIAPWDLPKSVLRQLSAPRSKLDDFVFTTHLPIDHGRQLRHDYSSCGLTFGSDFGERGSGYSWVGHVDVDCANKGVYTHEWLHQVEWGLHRLSGFVDLYNGNYPACGLGDPDETKWFPSSHDCLRDPDFINCADANGSCGGNDVVNEHILRAHWKPGRVLFGNHCKNGVHDSEFGETSTDKGGKCPSISEEFDVGSPFTVVRGGTFAVSGGAFVLTNPATTSGVLDANLAVHDTALPAGDYLLTALGRVTDTSGTTNDFSIVFNYQNSTNYYYASFCETNDGNTNGIFRVQNGTRTQLADFSSTITSGVVYRIQVERSGNQINVYRDGMLAATANDSSFSAGKVGVGSRDDGAMFDDIVVN